MAPAHTCMIEAVQELAAAIRIEENYKWEIPDNLPLEIPTEFEGALPGMSILKRILRAS